ncbi:MAG: hypothetical protein KDJ63_09220 [Nitratireductor sp.]|nr:hypothetical protein [Nitratireductor sp.]
MEDGELERHLRDKWQADKPQNEFANLPAEDQEIARKILGWAEFERLKKRKDQNQRFRPRKEKPPNVVVEYYEVQSGFNDNRDSLMLIWGGWTIDVRVDGVIRQSVQRLSAERCRDLITKISRMNVQVRPIVTEWMRQKAVEEAAAKNRNPPSRRKAILDQLKGFRG